MKFKFTTKTDFSEFLTHKELSNEDFEALEVSKQDALISEFNKGMRDAQNEALEGKASKEDLEALKAEILAQKDKQADTILAMLAKRNGKTAQELESESIIADSFLKVVQGKEEDLAKLANKSIDKVNFTVKSPITVGNINTIEAVGSASQTSLTSDTGIVSPLRKRILTYLDNVSVGGLGVDAPFSMWIEELDEQGNPIFHGELNASPQVSVRYEERTMKAKTVSAFGKITKDFLRYSSKLVNYMQNNLLKRLDIVLENGLFTGDGQGNNLNGLVTYATAFDGGKGVKDDDGLVGKVVKPNNYDVLRALALQVYNSFGVASAVFIDSDKLAEMELSKDENDNYILPPFKSADGTVISGMQLIPTTASLGGFDFVGGDLSAVNVEFLLDLDFEIARDGNDMTNRMFTVLAERQLTQFVSANDTQVLVKGNFATAKDLIATT